MPSSFNVVVSTIDSILKTFPIHLSFFTYIPLYQSFLSQLAPNLINSTLIFVLNPFIMKTILTLTILSFLLAHTHAQKKCASTCGQCIGTDFCAFSNSTNCKTEDINCSEPCLDIAVRKQKCFDASVPNGKNCDSTCDFCIRDYKCNLAMESAGLCSSDRLLCDQNEKCLDGPAKKLCSSFKNTGQCRVDCDTCTFSDDCTANSNSTQCIDNEVDCLSTDSCMHNKVRTAKCFASSVPGNNTCSAECDTCITQYKCNPIMENLGYCRKGNVHCLEIGQCLDGEAHSQCDLSRESESCLCDACFSKLDCSKESIQQEYGLCDGDKLFCEGQFSRCIAKQGFDKSCDSFGFCTLNKSASIWVKARCFIIAIITVLGVILLVWGFYKCITPKPFVIFRNN